MILIAMIILVVGYMLMYYDGQNKEEFNPDIFNFRRITLAPAIVLVGYVLIGVGIMKQ